MVERTYEGRLRRSDAREQLLEQYYRTCRRHSGLTTEGQFQDTTGQLDLPVEETDTTSRVGFSHNSLREYLVADAFADHLNRSTHFEKLNTVTVTEAVQSFFANLTAYSPDIPQRLEEVYKTCTDSNLRERLFRLLLGLIDGDAKQHIGRLGEPADLRDLDLSGLDLSGLPLRNGNFSGSILPDTDLRNADLREARLDGAILSRTMLDGASLKLASFARAEIQSIYVFDQFSSRTKMILEGKNARQWLFSHGAVVSDESELNPLLGKPWYEAAREVTRTLEHRIAGTHQDSSLAKGTSLKYRHLAQEFVKHLRSRGVLQDVKRSGKGTWVVKVKAEHRHTIREFSEDGVIGDVLRAFFDKYSEERKSASQRDDLEVP